MISVCVCVWIWQNADKTLINTIDWRLGTYSINMCTNTIKVQSTNTIEHSTPRKIFPLLHFHPKNISSSKKINKIPVFKKNCHSICTMCVCDIWWRVYLTLFNSDMLPPNIKTRGKMKEWKFQWTMWKVFFLSREGSFVKFCDCIGGKVLYYKGKPLL